MQMQPNEMKQIVLDALDELKAIDVVVLNVSDLTYVTDFMVVCSGRASRHVKSIADNVVVKLKQAGVSPVKIERDSKGEWILVDAGDVVVHVMMPQTRAFYQKEKLWEA